MPTPPSVDVNLDGIRRNVAASNIAKELFEFVPDLVRINRTDEDRVWEALAREAAARIGKKLVDDGPRTKMGNKEAEAFMYDTMPYGELKGKRVGEVSAERLAYYAESDFMRKLLRYVGCDHFLERQKKEGRR